MTQEMRGLTYAALILGAWLALHVYAVFFHSLAAAPLLTLALMAVLCWLSVGLFILAHDAMHGTLAPLHPALGRSIGTLALALYAGFSLHRLLPKHQAHHQCVGTRDDPDFDADHPAAFGPWYFTFMRQYFGMREVFIMGMRVGIYWLLGAPLENILLLFALPAIGSSVQLFYFGTWLPHRHHSDFIDHHRARSNEYATLWSLLSCFHFGYHHEHHRSPGTPWWCLPALRRETRRS